MAGINRKTTAEFKPKRKRQKKSNFFLMFYSYTT